MPTQLPPPMTETELHDFTQTLKNVAVEVGQSLQDVRHRTYLVNEDPLSEAMEAARRFYMAMSALEYTVRMSLPHA